MISKYPKRIFCIFLISLFIVFNFYALNLGFRTIGVYDSNNPFFYPILKSLNTTTYMISADSTVSFDLSSAPVKISLHHQSEVFDLLATIEQIDSSQYTIEVFTEEEKRAWLDKMENVTLGSDAFFPFSDNIERAKKSGVKYIAEPGGSVRDDLVIETCDKYGMVMAFTGIRLFHH